MNKFWHKVLYVYIFNLVWISPVFSQTDNTNKICFEYTTKVFQSGEAHYEFYRIPSLLSDGSWLYAFSEGRKNSVSDHGPIDIVLKISKDAGKNWGKLIRITEFNDQSCQNPTPVYIEGENKILLLFTKRTIASDTEDKIRAGTSEGYVGAYLTESLNNGLSWSPVREITDQVKLKSWLWYSFGPGGAIIFKSEGPFEDRIIIPANHSIEGGNGNEFLGAHVVYSVDHGKSWHIGAIDSEGQGSVNPNELAVVETKSGTLYFNARNQNYRSDPISNRAITYSRDGGITFVRKFFHEPQLITPIVHGSLARLDDKILFAAPYDTLERKNLSLWISHDETLTWDPPKLLQKGPTAYSSTILINKEIVGILYETGTDNPYQEILFKAITLE